MADEAKLVVFGMGGTIDKDYPRSSGGYAFEIDEPAAQRILRGLPFLGISWSVQSVCKKDSTEITDADRELLVRAVAQCSAKRIVVTHGTDTLIQTAQHVARSGAASGKAIAFTGAMKPERFVDSDATFNLGAAVAATGLLAAESVVVVMGGQVIDCYNCARNLITGMLISNFIAPCLFLVQPKPLHLSHTLQHVRIAGLFEETCPES